MYSREQSSSKAKEHSTSAPKRNPFAPRPFPIQKQAHSSDSQQENQDLDANYERAKRFEHNIANIPVNAPGTPPPQPPQLQAISFSAPTVALKPIKKQGKELLTDDLTQIGQHNSNVDIIQCANLKSPRFSDNTEVENAYNGKSSIKKGDSGWQVRLIQQALLDMGYSFLEYGVDGEFNDETQAAVKAFQEKHQLINDGIVASKTMKELDKFFLNHGNMAAIPQGQVPLTAPREGEEWNGESIPSELLEGTGGLTLEEKAEVERRRTTEVKAPPGESLPDFQMYIPSSSDSYEKRVERKTNEIIDKQYDNYAKGKADARKDPDKNLYKWDIIEKIALRSKAETDRVFGNYAKGKPFRAQVNLNDAWEEKEKQFATLGKPFEEKKIRWRVNQIFSGSSIRQIDEEYGAVQSRATEQRILINIREQIISKRRAELIEIHKGWQGFAKEGKVYLQRFVSEDDVTNRNKMWKLFTTSVHEYIHTLEHSKSKKYYQSLDQLKGSKTYREGMVDYFTKIVLDSINYDDNLRKEVEGPYHKGEPKHPIPEYSGYPEAENAEAVVGVVGLRNAMAAFFAGRVDLIGG